MEDRMLTASFSTDNGHAVFSWPSRMNRVDTKDLIDLMKLLIRRMERDLSNMDQEPEPEKQQETTQ